MGIKFRLTLWISAMVAVILLATLGVVYQVQSNALVTALESRRNDDIARLQRITEETLAAKEERILLSYLRVWMRTGDVFEVGVWDMEGRLQLHSDFLSNNYKRIEADERESLVAESNKESEQSIKTLRRSGREALAIALPVFNDGRRFGSTIVFYDVAKMQARQAAAIDEMTQRFGAIVAGGLALSFFVSFLLAAGLTRPISVLSTAAQEIGHGKFDTRVDVHGRDELGHLADDLRNMAAQLKELDEMKSRFLQSVSHNMRSPLAAATSAVYHAHAVVKPEQPDLREDINIIDLGLQDLTRFINNLLDFEKLKAGKLQLQKTTIKTADMLQHIRRMFERAAEERQVSLIVEPTEGPVTIWADEKLIREVVENLLVNALKYAPAGGSVHLGALQLKTGARLWVRDSGPGIPAEDLDAVFGRFDQSKAGSRNVGNIKSTGLGLALCREMVLAHGGRIWAENAASGGAVFQFDLPAQGREVQA
jgi:signal transduction histidine kinase